MKTLNWQVKPLICFLLSSVALLYGLLPAPLSAANAPSGIVVTYLEDRAMFRTDANAPWQDIVIGQELFPKYEIQTLRLTRMTIRLGDGSEVRVAPNTLLRINPQTDTQIAKFDLQLLLGKAWAKFRKNVRLGAKLIIRTAHAKINVQGTSYEASVFDDQTQVRVFTGEVAVSNSTLDDQIGEVPTEIEGPHEVSREEWQVIVSAFYTITVGENQDPTDPQPFSLESVQDEWVDWNLDQDEDI